ncbi:MAG: palindromic element RPE1 domain-containing protein [Candidatus Tisiphia sp.]|nr:MAG: palindromic element RPE1 domain-containing protein [Rickettsia endosymbiont of Cimex lectularius]
MTQLFNRPLAKFASVREFVGDTERKTAAYSSVREDLSTGITHKLPAEVELRKRSNNKSKVVLLSLIISKTKLIDNRYLRYFLLIL